MEEFKKKNGVEMSDKEIVFSKSIKAGKRIYYLDVKKNRKDEMFLAITESKKVVTGEGEDTQVSFEKHKIFLYKEDFDKFTTGLEQAISFITENQGTAIQRDKITESKFVVDNADEALEPAFADEVKVDGLGGEIKIDIEFE